MFNELPLEEKQDILKLQFARGKTGEWYGWDLQKTWIVEKVKMKD